MKTTDPDEHRPACLVQADEQRELLEAMLPDLLPIYMGKFVAFSEGAVIDSDKDDVELDKRTRRTHKEKFVLIFKIRGPNEPLPLLDALGT